MLRNVSLFNHATKVSVQIFSRGRRGLFQTYLFEFVEMILTVPIQCNMTKIALEWCRKDFFRWASMRGRVRVRFIFEELSPQVKTKDKIF